MDKFWEEDLNWAEAFDCLGDAICLLGLNRTIIRCNAAMLKFLGKTQDKVIGRPCWEVVHGFDGPIEDCPFDSVSQTLKRQAFDLKMGENWFRVNIDPYISQKTGKQIGYIHILTDITYRKKTEEEDELTGLYNRRGFFTLARQQIKIARRMKKRIWIFYGDMDGLKAINDNFGHKEGDYALVAISNILRATFRESDIIARIGGDEFVIMAIEDKGGKNGFGRPLLRLAKNLESRKKENNQYTLFISMAAVPFDPQKGSASIEELLGKADRLMYEEKRRKKKAREEG